MLQNEKIIKEIIEFEKKLDNTLVLKPEYYFSAYFDFYTEVETAKGYCSDIRVRENDHYSSRIIENNIIKFTFRDNNVAMEYSDIAPVKMVVASIKTPEPIYTFDLDVLDDECVTHNINGPIHSSISLTSKEIKDLMDLGILEIELDKFYEIRDDINEALDNPENAQIIIEEGLELCAEKDIFKNNIPQGYSIITKTPVTDLYIFTKNVLTIGREDSDFIIPRIYFQYSKLKKDYQLDILTEQLPFRVDSDTSEVTFDITLGVKTLYQLIKDGMVTIKKIKTSKKVPIKLAERK